MRGSTHLIAGLTTAALIPNLTVPAMAALTVGAVLPDIDHKESLVGRHIPILPRLLKHRGVTVTNFINKLTLPDYLKINFETNLKGQRFSSNIEAILYRVICELVNNAIKHADPSVINIKLQLEDKEHISLVVEDNGCGFDPEKDDKTNGMGLSNINSRISSLKGDMNIDSKKGEGTRVSIRISVN